MPISESIQGVVQSGRTSCHASRLIEEPVQGEQTFACCLTSRFYSVARESRIGEVIGHGQCLLGRLREKAAAGGATPHSSTGRSRLRHDCNSHTSSADGVWLLGLRLVRTSADLAHDAQGLGHVGFRVNLGRLDLAVAEDDLGRLQTEFGPQVRRGGVPQLQR